MRHRNQHALDLAGVLGRRHAAGGVGGDLVAEEVEVHPGLGAAAFAAAEDLAIEPAGGLEVADEEGEVERLGHGTLAGEDATTCGRPAPAEVPPGESVSGRYILQRMPHPPLPHSSVAPVSREAADASTPPMLKHWREVKAQHPQTILFYRVGDFYEMFHEDAELAARVLEITLTSRGDGVPLAGVPVKAAADYLRQLIGAGPPGGDLRAGRGPEARPGPGAPRGRGDGDARRHAAGRLARGRPEQLPRGARGCGRAGRARRDRPQHRRVSARDPGRRRRAPRRWDAWARRRSWCPATSGSGGRWRASTVRERWEFDPDLAREELARRFSLASLDGLGVGPEDAPRSAPRAPCFAT